MGEIILLVVAIALVVALYVISINKRKKHNAEMTQMRDELKNGDKVMTDSGIVGVVADSYTEDEYKYIVLKSGKGENTGFFTVHANAIYYVFDKEDKKAEEAKEPIVEDSKPSQSKPKNNAKKSKKK